MIRMNCWTIHRSSPPESMRAPSMSPLPAHRPMRRPRSTSRRYHTQIPRPHSAPTGQPHNSCPRYSAAKCSCRHRRIRRMKSRKKTRTRNCWRNSTKNWMNLKSLRNHRTNHCHHTARAPSIPATARNTVRDLSPDSTSWPDTQCPDVVPGRPRCMPEYCSSWTTRNNLPQTPHCRIPTVQCHKATSRRHAGNDFSYFHHYCYANKNGQHRTLTARKFCDVISAAQSMFHTQLRSDCARTRESDPRGSHRRGRRCAHCRAHG